MSDAGAQPLPDPMLPESCEIRGVVEETHDTVTFDLIPPQATLSFAPGQFNMLYLFGVGEVPISISGDPNRPEQLMHTLRAVGSVTNAMKELGAGDFVGVRGPFGTAWPLQEAVGKDVLVIAGGIGLAPLRPAIYALLARREAYGRITILYGTRTPRDILFDQELMQWRGRHDLEVDVTVDRGEDGWRGRTGVVTKLLERAELDSDRAVVMMCGPEIMMRFCVRELEHRNITDSQIYVTLERNMQCAIAHCGHCQFGSELLCRDGPVYRYDRVRRLFSIREI